MKNFIRNYVFSFEAALLIIPVTAFILWPGLLSNLFNSNFTSFKVNFQGIPTLLSLHVLSDTLIGAAYMGISVALIYLVARTGQDIPYSKVFLAFSIFIISSGITHLFAAFAIWKPYYWLFGGIKFIAGVISVLTALLLPFIIPKVILLVNESKTLQETKDKLESTNKELEKEVKERQLAEDKLKKAHSLLELRVQERTAQLEKINLSLTNEIVERERAEYALRESENLFRELAENIRDVFYIYDPFENIITYASPATQEIWGITKTELYNDYSVWINSIYEEDKERVLSSFKNLKTTGKVDEQYRIVKPDNTLRWVRLRTFPIKDKEDKIIRIAGIAEDITEKKYSEEKLQNSLAEKEILIREIHHRVKNNLQIVSSLLNLQSSYIKDKETLEVFRESKNRIKFMALIHEKLYGPKDFVKINFSEYIEELTAYLFSAYSFSSGDISLKIDIDNIYLNMDTAITLGLITNELISNSLKYAFDKNKKGEIYIKLFLTPDNTYTLIIKDNGKGLPENYDINKSDTLGLQLVQMFMKQVDGKISYKNNNGAEFTINFK